MNLDQEYRLGITLARNNWIIRNTRDANLKARVSQDSQQLRRQLAGAA